MFFRIPYYHPSPYPYDRKIWIKIRFLYETEKAVLVYCNGRKTWIAKSRIYKVRLKKSVFEVYAKESLIE
ncbi:MAG: hypothetical protein K9L61_04180 [Candidatus Omnitrophica bacterium]|nr:hypothetical protein [Candidatus Omnitrophota bacterium]